MKRLNDLLRNHSAKLWLLVTVIACLTALNLGAASGPPTVQQWEYKCVWFQVAEGEKLDEIQKAFAKTLNLEARNGWEFTGRCGHSDTSRRWIDFVVFRRPRQ